MYTLLMIIGFMCLFHAIATLQLETQATVAFIIFVLNFILMLVAFSFWGILGTIFSFMCWCTIMADIDKQKKK